MTNDEIEQEFYAIIAEEMAEYQDEGDWKFGDVQHFTDGMPALDEDFDWDGS